MRVRCLFLHFSVIDFLLLYSILVCGQPIKPNQSQLAWGVPHQQCAKPEPFRISA
jgi:hypothetical protein